MKRFTSFALKILGAPFAKGEMGGKGQIAIFAALIFQVLFVFFAMVVNVGLLVHHKINLQNSVDLAAYYGAMRQAEVLNAVAHINYQIRQSWKLMAFRFRGIGMSGNDRPDAPYDLKTGTIQSAGSSNAEYTCPASFCVAYQSWETNNDTENTCKNPCGVQRVTLPGTPFGSSLLGGLLHAALPGITSAVDALSNFARSTVKLNCEKHGVLSWYALGRYIFAFKNDVASRKRVLNRLANSMSYDTRDFMDLDGQSARRGALQTLWKNLTYQNQASIDPASGSGEGNFEFFNSLAAGGCGGTQGEESVPPRWLAEIFMKPIYAYMDGSCGESSLVEYIVKPLNVTGDTGLPYYYHLIDPAIREFIRAYATDPTNFDSGEARLYHTTIGYEKNPWCMAYVGVKATTKPKIPFSPFSGVALSAQSYAKPFGGRIGPWYYRTWPQSAPESTGGRSDQVDKTLPPRVRSGDGSISVNDDFQRIDHARYVGDEIGVKSGLTMGHYQSAFNKRNSHLAKPKISHMWWNHLLDSTSDLSSPGSHGDILSWDASGPPNIRRAEVSVVIPDNFDLSYYSIEPYFWRTYAQRIQKRTDFQALHVRGDLGYRKGGGGNWETFSIKDQIQLAFQDNAIDYNGALTYYAGRNKSPQEGFTELLTSWHNKVPGDYRLDQNRFGKCFNGAILGGGPGDVDHAQPGNCAAGGRTGYSVKLVDEEHLTSEQSIGGAGLTGRIKNLPPGF